MSWLHSWPLLLIGLIVFATLIASAELGYAGARRVIARQRNRAAERSSKADDRDYLLTAVLALMTLLLGFTFSLSLNRFEVRRDLVVQEANALDTAWLSAQLLRAPDRANVSRLLRAYIGVRRSWSEAYSSEKDAAGEQRLRSTLWVAVGAAVRAEPSQTIGRKLIDATSESFDLATARLAARTANIPDRVLNVLVLYIVLSVVMLSQLAATRDAFHRASTWTLLLLLTLAFIIILDLDRNGEGAIMVSQQPLADLSAAIR
jgi:hypothetical protein